MIREYIDAMLAQDYRALADCFSPKCRLFDYCPIGNNMENFHVCGRTAVEMFFHNKFYFNTIHISDPNIIDDDTADYFVAYGGQYLHVQARIESYDEEKISVLIIRPL